MVQLDVPARGSERLTIVWADHHDWRVSLRADGLTAEARLDVGAPHARGRTLATMLGELAEPWSGWEGERT